MSTTSTSTNPISRRHTRARTGRLRPAGLLSGIVAAVATTLTVVVAHAAGEPVMMSGKQIPASGFAIFTIIGALFGIAIATILSRRARRPRTMFLRTTIVLTAVSIVPDVVSDATAKAKLVLIATHLIAAAIIVPVIAARVAGSRSDTLAIPSGS
jgi:hypothetical protein